MRPSVRWLLLCVALLGLTVPAHAEEATTPDQLRVMLANKQYQEVLQQTAKLLTLRGDAAKGVDRYAVLMIKGEAQIQLKQGSYAADTFAQAAVEAAKPGDADAATAMAELVRKSPGLKYVPAGQGTPIDITDPVNRKAALTALYADVSAAQTPAIRAAVAATTLGPITDQIQKMRLPRILEVAATGSDARSAAAMKDLGSRAREIMAAAVKDRHDEVRKIYDAASSILPAGSAPASPLILKPGLSSRDKDRLKAIMQECDMIASAARQIADAASVDGMAAVAADALAVKEDAQRTLTTDFANAYGNPAAPTPTPRGP